MHIYGSHYRSKEYTIFRYEKFEEYTNCIGGLLENLIEV
jgi:hypothetical protein